MKTQLRAVVAAAFGLSLGTAPAQASADVTSKTTYYAIPGKTGAQLYASMVKLGPRHGLLSRAIAQSRYDVKWDAQVEPVGGGRRVARVRPTLSITYAYPKPAEHVALPVKVRWARFMTGVRRHEEMHGRIARQMVNAARASIRGLKIAGDKSCSKTRREVRRRVDAVYALYEARQVRFDEVEHRDGGKIERLIADLVKSR